MNQLNDREFEIIQNKEFLIAKATAISKITGILSKTRKELKKFLSENSLLFPDISVFKTDKISRGENYLGLPYLVLDYPAVFSREGIFAYRTMFWWGNFFSATLHLDGDYLNYYRHKLINKLDELELLQIYIGIGDSPWQYHYEKDNYLLLSPEHKKHIEDCTFLKLSKKINLKSWDKIPEISLSFYQQLATILNSE